ncbi:MAG: PadR family transcriptional regulator [Clostridiales bacterium]|nr:PadR family transcriptional regulator [Clostridiales bacterium]
MRDNAKSGALTEVTFFVLISLYEPNHGYGIMQFIEAKTQGRLILGAGSLYGAINALQDRNWIMPLDDGTGRKKEYIITDTGKEVVNSEIRRLQELVRVATDIVGEKI